MAGRETKVDRTTAGATTNTAPFRVVYDMLVAYEQGKETAREIDEQLAALALQVEPEGARDARRVLYDWLRQRNCDRLRQFLQDRMSAGPGRPGATTRCTVAA